MVTINVRFIHITAERTAETLPPKIQFQTQLSLPSGDIGREDGRMKIPFIFNVTTTPPVANMSFKGYVFVEGNKEELDKVYKELTVHHKPPQYLLIATLHNNMIEAVLMSREIGVPPPIPLPQLQAQFERNLREYRGTQTI